MRTNLKPFVLLIALAFTCSQIANAQNQTTVPTDSSHRTSAFRGERSRAEKLAKYLRRKMEKDEKKSK